MCEKWKNSIPYQMAEFPHSKTTLEPSENIFQTEVTEFYFKEISNKGTYCDTNVCVTIQFEG